MRRLQAYLIAFLMIFATVASAFAGEVVQFVRPEPQYSLPVAGNDNTKYVAATAFAQRLLQRMSLGTDGKLGIPELAAALGIPTNVLLPQFRMLSGGANDALSYRLTPEQFMASISGAEDTLAPSGHDDCGMLFGITALLVANAWHFDANIVKKTGDTAMLYSLCPIH